MTARIDHSLRPALLPAEDAAILPETPAAPVAEGGALDDATVAYVLAAQAHFAGLKQAEGQLGGLLLLAAAGSKSITQEHAMLESARMAHAEAADGIAGLSVPARARHHHHHLSEAAAAIGSALDQTRRSLHGFAAGRRDVDEALRPLKLGHRHLDWASRSLPGFEMVNFQQACCAGHAAEAGDAKQ
jgi:hypothetical protein